MSEERGELITAIDGQKARIEDPITEAERLRSIIESMAPIDQLCDTLDRKVSWIRGRLDMIPEMQQEIQRLRRSLDLVPRICGTCKWFFRYSGDPAGDTGFCRHPTPIRPQRAYYDDDSELSLVDEDTCEQWKWRREP